MANNENLIPIPGRLHSVATEGHVAGADEIYDDTQSKLQSAINADVAEDISDLQEIVGEGSVDTRIENAIKALDAEKSQTAGADGLALSVAEVDGKITSISGSIAANTYDSYGSASAAQEAAATDATTKVNTAKAELLGDAATDYNTLGKLEDAIQSEASTRETEIGTDSTAGSVKGRIKSLETLVGSTSVDSQIDAKINALDSTKSQTAGADGLALSIEEEDGKIKSISGSIAANTYDAYGAASTVKTDLLGDAASDYNTLGKLEDAIQAEATTRSGETEALDGRLDDIEEVIPSAATSSNQLADKAFVNSSISTATAEFQGSYNSVSDLELTTSATHAQIATALGTEISGADNNDYCFVQIPTADATPTDIAKVERYKYNGTAWSFEYELNNSGYTDAQWAAINSGITSNLVTAFGNKYDKPSTGIPSTDMTSDVQTSLGKADSAYQKPSGGIPDSDLTSAVQTSLGKADTAYQKPSGGIPASDLADGVIPDISGKANKNEMSVVDGIGADADKTTITLKDGTSATVLKSHQDISGKQDVIDSTHKLAADLVDDTSSANKFTNATEKQTWNAKQDALTFNTTPSADNNVATMADIEDATENCAYLEEDDGSEVIADFDPQTDTVWKKAQTLSNAEKSQVKTNLGLPQEIYSKTEVNNLITTPNQQYVTVATYASLPASGSADTIYRVSNYNGSTSQVDPTMYSEYAWNGTAYEFLCVKSQIGEVFDITAYNSNTKYADLTAALGTNGANVPEGVRKGGMSVKYVSNSDNKYVQARCMAQNFTTDTTQWQGVDNEPVAGSKNLVKSGGVMLFNENINKSEEDYHSSIVFQNYTVNIDEGIKLQANETRCTSWFYTQNIRYLTISPLSGFKIGVFVVKGFLKPSTTNKSAVFDTYTFNTNQRKIKIKEGYNTIIISVAKTSNDNITPTEAYSGISDFSIITDENLIGHDKYRVQSNADVINNSITIPASDRLYIGDEINGLRYGIKAGTYTLEHDNVLVLNTSIYDENDIYDNKPRLIPTVRSSYTNVLAEDIPLATCIIKTLVPYIHIPNNRYINKDIMTLNDITFIQGSVDGSGNFNNSTTRIVAAFTGYNVRKILAHVTSDYYISLTYSKGLRGLGLAESNDIIVTPWRKYINVNVPSNYNTFFVVLRKQDNSSITPTDAVTGIMDFTVKSDAEVNMENNTKTNNILLSNLDFVQGGLKGGGDDLYYDSSLANIICAVANGNNLSRIRFKIKSYNTFSISVFLLNGYYRLNEINPSISHSYYAWSEEFDQNINSSVGTVAIRIRKVDNTAMTPSEIDDVFEYFEIISDNGYISDNNTDYSVFTGTISDFKANVISKPLVRLQNYNISCQGCSSYNNTAFVFKANNKCYMYNIADGSSLGNVTFPNSLHANTMQFAKELHSGNTQFPYLYISEIIGSTDGEEPSWWRIFVYDISVNNGAWSVSLVQTINTQSISEGNRGLGPVDFTIDTDDNVMWLICQATTSLSGGDHYFLKINIPSISESTVNVTDSDILDSFNAGHIDIRQDNIYYNGKVYIIRGHRSKYGGGWLVVVDLEQKLQTAEVYLTPIEDDEPEGIILYNQKLAYKTAKGDTFHELMFL